jgi:hypothetical protein
MDRMAGRKGRCMPLILCYKKGVFRFARFAKIASLTGKRD